MRLKDSKAKPMTNLRDAAMSSKAWPFEEARKLVKRFAKAPPEKGYVLFETSNPRHGHEWAVFRDRAADIPDDKVLVPGVVDTTTNFVEHPDLVAERIGRFVNIVGHDRVIAGSDCGFGTFAGFGAVDPEIAFAKLGALAAGAAQVS